MEKGREIPPPPAILFVPTSEVKMVPEVREEGSGWRDERFRFEIQVKITPPKNKLDLRRMVMMKTVRDWCCCLRLVPTHDLVIDGCTFQQVHCILFYLSPLFLSRRKDAVEIASDRERWGWLEGRNSVEREERQGMNKRGAARDWKDGWHGRLSRGD